MCNKINLINVYIIYYICLFISYLIIWKVLNYFDITLPTKSIISIFKTKSLSVERM